MVSVRAGLPDYGHVLACQFAGPGARLHEVVTRWLTELFGLPTGTAAVLVSGASLANTTALAAARDHQLARAGEVNTGAFDPFPGHRGVGPPVSGLGTR
jgi:hypothetical protein